MSPRKLFTVIYVVHIVHSFTMTASPVLVHIQTTTVKVITQKCNTGNISNVNGESNRKSDRCQTNNKHSHATEGSFLTRTFRDNFENVSYDRSLLTGMDSESPLTCALGTRYA